jgi:hypothetical protein
VLFTYILFFKLKKLPWSFVNHIIYLPSH